MPEVTEAQSPRTLQHIDAVNTFYSADTIETRRYQATRPIIPTSYTAEATFSCVRSTFRDDKLQSAGVKNFGLPQPVSVTTLTTVERVPKSLAQSVVATTTTQSVPTDLLHIQPSTTSSLYAMKLAEQEVIASSTATLPTNIQPVLTLTTFSTTTVYHEVSSVAKASTHVSASTAAIVQTAVRASRPAGGGVASQSVIARNSGSKRMNTSCLWWTVGVMMVLRAIV